MSDPMTQLHAARDLQARGDTEGAYRSLVALLSSGVDPLAGDGLLAAAVALLADLSRSFRAEALAGELDACRANPEDPAALYDIAYDLYEQGQFAAGAALLYRANALSPGESEIVTELSGCLERQLRYADAAQVLDDSGLAASDPLCAYLSGFNRLMCGDLELPRERLRVLAEVAEPQLLSMRESLASMLARADALRGAGISLDDRALTAWQAAINGTLLLHCSPHGYPDPMRGRYAYVGDSPGLEREGLERLRAVLAELGALPPRVVAAPDRASRILATAASRLLGVPLALWSADDSGPALIVVWSLEAVESDELLSAMRDHAPGQRLFVHASSWTEPFPYAPDATAFLHQSVTCPWTGGAMRVDPGTREVVRAPADERSEDALASEILAAPISDPSASDLSEVLAVARAIAGAPPEARGGLWRSEGPRLRQRAGGPVPSNRFV